MNGSRRSIGQSGPEITPLVLGGNTFGWTVDRAETFRILDTFIDAGYETLDTADVYSTWVPGHMGGESEALIGGWLKDRRCRSRVILCSKVGGEVPGIGQGLSAAHIIKSVEVSLRRLQTDYLDLYQSHVDDPSCPLDETLEAYRQLIQAGKVREVGASHYNTARLRDAARVSEQQGLPRYASLQHRYNLLDRSEFEGELQQACIDLRIGLLAYSPLAKGFLTGVYSETSSGPKGAWQQMVADRYTNRRGFQTLKELCLVANELAAPPSQVALRWVLYQPGVTAPVVGVENAQQLRELIGYERIVIGQAQLSRLSLANDI